MGAIFMNSESLDDFCDQLNELLALEDRVLNDCWYQHNKGRDNGQTNRVSDESLRAGVRSFLKGITAERGTVLTRVPHRQQDSKNALETLGLPEELEHVLGIKGLGIRMVTQLTQFSRAVLMEQFWVYAQESHADPEAPLFSECDVERWLDLLEVTLEQRGFSLAE